MSANTDPTPSGVNFITDPLWFGPPWEFDTNRLPALSKAKPTGVFKPALAFANTVPTPSGVNFSTLLGFVFATKRFPALSNTSPWGAFNPPPAVANTETEPSGAYFRIVYAAGSSLETYRFPSVSKTKPTG